MAAKMALATTATEAEVVASRGMGVAMMGALGRSV